MSTGDMFELTLKAIEAKIKMLRRRKETYEENRRTAAICSDMEEVKEYERLIDEVDSQISYYEKEMLKKIK